MGSAISADESDPRSGKETLSLWEFKIFGAGYRLPHYRGSEEYKTYILPIPYIEYRGEFFRTDREGAHGIFYESENFQTTLSAYGNPPVEEGGDAREGMDELDPLVELGPAIKWYPKGRRSEAFFYLHATTRAVISINLPDSFKSRYQGIHGTLSLVHVDHALFLRRDWQSRLTVGIDLTDSLYNGYFYDVAEGDVFPGRPAYNAGGGYGGMFLSGSLLKKFTERLSVSGYARWENLKGAVFEDSPLVETDHNFSVGAMLVWTAYRSKKQVDVYSEDDFM